MASFFLEFGCWALMVLFLVVQGVGLVSAVNNKLRDDVIEQCFKNGYSYKEILAFLFGMYNIKLREMIRQMLLILDPAGVEARSHRRLKRRKYSTKGPNYTWHLDGFDKLKPFGFCIHGCIDGYSRKLLWLEVDSSNNDPKLIANYFLKYVRSIQGTARKIRGDCGTENYNVAAIQRFFRRNAMDSFADDKSFIFGKSTSNQRIEAWWSQMKRCNANWWINFFKDMRSQGLWSDSDPVERECLKFCFMAIIQKELNEVQVMHNTHRIRPQPNQECPNGKPNLIYSLPGAYGTSDFKQAVNQNEVSLAKRMCCKTKGLYGSSQEFAQLAMILMADNHLRFPTNATEAKILYLQLLRLIQNI